jgi:hypothetical protein
MIFALASAVPGAPMDTLFLFFNEQDVITMRQGRTLFVDQRQLKGATFKQVITALGQTDADAVALIQKANGLKAAAVDLDPPAPAVHESKCPGCGGLVATATMFEGRCIVCWATEAKRLRAASN